MSRELYQARSKKTVKMGRDGLVETDRATGEERRVSRKETEVSFDRMERGSGELRESVGEAGDNGAERAPQSDRVSVERRPAVRVTDSAMERVQDRVSVGRGADHAGTGNAGRTADSIPAGRGTNRLSGKDAQAPTQEHGPQSRTARRQQQRQKIQEQMAREAQDGDAGGDWIAEYLPDFAAPDAGLPDASLSDAPLDIPPPDAAAEMRGAADMPMFAPSVSAVDAPKPDGGRAGKRRLKGTEKGGKRLGKDGGERLKPDGKERENPEGRGRTGLRGPGDGRLAARDARRSGEGRLKGGNRLRFSDAGGRDTGKQDPREKLKKRQTKQLAADAARPEIPEAVTLSPASAGRDYTVSKLRFPTDREPVADGGESREQTGETAAADGVLAISILARAAARFKRPAKKRKTDRGRLQFDRENDGGQDARKGGETGAAAQKRRGTRHTPDAAKPEETRQTGGNGGESSSTMDAPSPVRGPSDRGTGPRRRFGERTGWDVAADQTGTIQREGTRQAAGNVQRQRTRQTRQARQFTPEAARRETEKPENPRRGNSGETPLASASSIDSPSDLSGPESSASGCPANSERTFSKQSRHGAGHETRRGESPRLRFERESGSEDKPSQSRQREKNRRAGQFTPEAGTRAGREAGDKKPDSVTRDRNAAAQRDTPEPSRTETAAKAATAVTERAQSIRYYRGRGDAPPAASPAPVPGSAVSSAQGSARSGQRLRFAKETGQPERGPGRDSAPDMATQSDAKSDAKAETVSRETAGHPAEEMPRRTGQKSGTESPRLTGENRPERLGQDRKEGPEHPGQDRKNGPEYRRQNRDNCLKGPDGDTGNRQPSDVTLQEKTARLRFEDESREAERESGETERNTEQETEKTTEREAEKDSSSENMERVGEAEAVPSREPPKPADAPSPARRSRLRFEDAPPHATPAQKNPSHAAPNAAAGEQKEKPTREQRLYEKAERRVEQASRKLEKAQSKSKRKLRRRVDKAEPRLRRVGAGCRRHDL